MGQLNKSQGNELQESQVQNFDSVVNSFFTKKFDDKEAEIYFKIAHLKQKYIRVKHSNLTEYIYSNYDEVKLEDGNNIDKEIFWQENVQALEKYLSNLLLDLDKPSGANFAANFTEEDKEKIKQHEKEIEELPYRIDDSIRLALSQYKVIFEKYNHAENGLEEVKKSYSEVSDKLDKATKESKAALDKLDKATKKSKAAIKKLDNSISEFISLLGIFSALIFGVFGGFEAFKSIFTNIDKASVNIVIIDSSILLLGLIILVFLLIQSISILSGKIFLACGCENTKKCSHKFYEKYPLFSFAVSLFLLILILGLLCKANKKLPFNFDLETILFYLGLIIIIIPIVAVLEFLVKKLKVKWTTIAAIITAILLLGILLFVT